MAQDKRRSNDDPSGKEPASKKAKYEYVSISDALGLAQRCEVVNLYGIVSQVSQPKRTKGPDFSLGFRLVDSSIGNTPQDVVYSSGKDLFCNIFMPSIDELPQTHVGDVVRLHRVKLNTYQGAVQAINTRGFSAVTVGPLNEDTITPLSFSGNITWTDFDTAQVQSLKTWARPIFSSIRTVINNVLITADKVKLNGTKYQIVDFAVKILDMQHFTDRTVLIVSDGTMPVPGLPRSSGYPSSFNVCLWEDVAKRHPTLQKGYFIHLQNVEIKEKATQNDSSTVYINLRGTIEVLFEGNPLVRTIQERIADIKVVQPPLPVQGAGAPTLHDIDSQVLDDGELETEGGMTAEAPPAEVEDYFCTEISSSESMNMEARSIKSITEDEVPALHRYHGRCSRIPANIPDISRLICSQCVKDFKVSELSRKHDDTPYQCPGCGEELCFEYMFEIDVKDDTGSLSLILFGSDADFLLGGIQPHNLHNDPCKVDFIRKELMKLVAPGTFSLHPKHLT